MGSASCPSSPLAGLGWRGARTSSGRVDVEGVKAVLPSSPGQGGSNREMPSQPSVLGLGSESSAGGATGW